MSGDGRIYDCCVIGGGPAGLLAAFALGLEGRRVLVLEQRSRDVVDAAGTKGLSRATTLQPATLSIFESLGLLERLAEGSARIIGGQVVIDGCPTVAFDYQDIPGCPVPFALSTPLPHAVGVLLDAIATRENIELAFSAKVSSLEPRGDRRFSVDVTVAGESKTIEPAFIVAADGKFSATRALAGIEAETVDFAPGYFDLNLPIPSDWDERIRVYFGAHGYLMVSPRVGEQLTLAWITDAHTADGYVAGPVEELVSMLSQAVPVLAADLRSHIRSWDQVRRTRHQAVRADRWIERNLVLLGDAAHGLHAFGGQGLNLALQDAACIARAVAAGLESADTERLREFLSVRKPFVDAFQDMQRSNLGEQATSRRPDPNNSLELEYLTLGQPEIRPWLAVAPAVARDS